MTGKPDGAQSVPIHMAADDIALDALFAEMRDGAAEPSAALLGRVLQEAEAAMPATPRAASEAVVRDRAAYAPPAGLRGILSGLGGWAGVGGLATAAVAGVWIGFAGVNGSGGVSSYLAGSDDAGGGTVELLPDMTAFAAADAAGG